MSSVVIIFFIGNVAANIKIYRCADVQISNVLMELIMGRWSEAGLLTLVFVFKGVQEGSAVKQIFRIYGFDMQLLKS